ncbi:MAG: lipocalin family protein [Pyrinomonadaceae bacterium]
MARGAPLTIRLDWFSIQLDSGEELMVYHIRDSQGRPSDFSSGTFVDALGHSTSLARADFQLSATDYWRSPHNGTIYPSGWRLEVPRRQIDLQITPTLKDQELDTRGTTMIVYWEGSCQVTGTRDNQPATGRAYVELVGYDRSHEQPSLTAFVLGPDFDRKWGRLFGGGR